MAQEGPLKEHDKLTVPEDFDLPDALIHPVPRPLPDNILHERHLKQLLLQIILGIIAVGCFVFSRLDWIQYMSLYFLPLAWLDWIGGGLLLIQFIALLRRNTLPVHLKAFRDGTAVPAIINDLVKKPEIVINGVPSQYAYFANVSLRLPGEPDSDNYVIKSIQLPNPDEYNCNYRVGDWVPALCMPVKGGYYINLYGFIGVDKNAGVIKLDKDKKLSVRNILKLSLLLMLLPGFFFVLFWNIYAMGRYSPLEMNFSDAWPALAVGAVAGLFFTFIWLLYSVRKAKMVKIANAEAVKNGESEEVYHDFWIGKGGSSWFIRIIVFVGLPLLSAVIIYCWAISLNALFDRSEARIEVVDIDRTYMETHAMVFRQYIIEYHFPGKSKKHKFLASYPHIAYFIDGKGAIVAVHKGAFGWPWVKKIAPL